MLSAGLTGLYFLQASPLLFRKGIDAPEVSQFNIDADGDSKVVRNQPSKEPVPARMRQYLPYAPNWTVWPDFQRVCIPVPVHLFLTQQSVT